MGGNVSVAMHSAPPVVRTTDTHLPIFTPIEVQEQRDTDSSVLSDGAITPSKRPIGIKEDHDDDDLLAPMHKKYKSNDSLDQFSDLLVSDSHRDDSDTEPVLKSKDVGIANDKHTMETMKRSKEREKFNIGCSLLLFALLYPDI